MTNFLTIDVEDYFQVHAFSGTVPREEWPKHELRVQKNTERILVLLDRYRTKATFFVLGWIAERAPDLVKAIAREGHEIASHGYAHQHIGIQSREEFRRDVRLSRDILETISGKPVKGYRAPTYSITNKTLWALSVLIEEGFRYDSSIFPVRHDYYGIPGAPRAPFKISSDRGSPTRFSELRTAAVQLGPAQSVIVHSGELLELPVATLGVWGLSLPIGGGGYFRLFPYPLIRWGLRYMNGHGAGFVFYLHPWEIDPEQPRVRDAPLLSRFRHYANLAKTQARFERLLQDFSFSPIGARISFE